jgi:hypothetical protein
LTNTAWAKICEAAGRRPNAEAEARAALSKVLFEDYPGFAYDPAAAAERAERMLEHLDAFAKLYRKTCHFPADQFEAILAGRAEAFVPEEDIETERGLWCIARLRRRTEAMLHGARTLQDAKTPRQTEQRAMLYHWLCGVWLDYFEGPELPPAGSARTPLVNFILAAMREIRPRLTLPRPDTVRDNIERERQEREPTRLRERMLWLRRMQSRG